MKWTRSVNPGGWMATWTSEDGNFEIQKHVGVTAHADYGHMTGQPYRVMSKVQLDTPDPDGSTFCWKYGPRFHLLKQAKSYVEDHLALQPSGLTAAQESWNKMVGDYQNA